MDDNERTDRLTAFGNQLILIHLRLREEFAALRAGTGRGPSRDLSAHCAAFCATLTRHHTGEDAGAFATLRTEVPELAPVLAELERDHRLVADALRRLDAATADPARWATEIDTLAALLETHFTYEERKLVDALNRLSGGTTEELLGITP